MFSMNLSEMCCIAVLIVFIYILSNINVWSLQTQTDYPGQEY